MKNRFNKLLACTLACMALIGSLCSVPVSASGYMIDESCFTAMMYQCGCTNEQVDIYTDCADTIMAEKDSAINIWQNIDRVRNCPYFMVLYPKMDASDFAIDTNRGATAIIYFFETIPVCEYGAYNNIKLVQGQSLRGVSSSVLLRSTGVSMANSYSTFSTYSFNTFFPNNVLPNGSKNNVGSNSAIWYCNFFPTDINGDVLSGATVVDWWAIEKMAYPQFDIPTYNPISIGGYVNISSILSDISNLDVVGALGGVIQALDGGLRFVADSTVNIVTHLALVVTCLFDWLSQTLPILYNNFLAELLPFLHAIVELVGSTPVGSVVTDFTELFGKLDTIKDGFAEIIPTDLKDIFTAIPLAMEETQNKIQGIFDSVISFLGSFVSNATDIMDKMNETKELIDNACSFLMNIPINLVNELRLQLVPSDNYFNIKLSSFQLYVYDRFPILSSASDFLYELQSMLVSPSRTAPDITFQLNTLVGTAFNYIVSDENKTVYLFSGCENITVSLDFFDSILPFTDFIIVAACYILTLVYSVRALPNIIGGIGSASSSISKVVETKP